jgi:hypothetical protein
MRNAYRILFRKGKRLLLRLQHRWEDNRISCGTGMGTVVTSRRHGSESLGYIKGDAFLG